MYYHNGNIETSASLLVVSEPNILLLKCPNSLFCCKLPPIEEGLPDCSTYFANVTPIC